MVYAALEFIQRRWQVNPEVTRKIAHVVSGIVAVAAQFWLPRPAYIVVVALFVLVFVVARIGRTLKSIDLRNRLTYGEVLFPIAILLMAILFYDNGFSFRAGVLVMALADPAAALAGTSKFGKTWSGSMAFFVVAWTILIILARMSGWGYSPMMIFGLAGVAGAGSLAERVSHYGLDNITVPLITATLLAFGA